MESTDSFIVRDDIIAISGRKHQALASTRADTLRFETRRNSIYWEIPDEAPDTPSLVEILDLANAGIAIYGRPLVAQSESDFTDDGDNRIYHRALIRAMLVGPVLGSDSDGWDAASLEETRAMTGKTEFRFIEFRNEGDTITGPVMVYGSEARFGDWREVFEPGSLKFDDVIVNIQHDRSKPVARTGAGLELRDSSKALDARISLPDTVYAREARELVNTNILRGFSVEFLASKERMEGRTRVIEEAKLYGFGLVDRPAYDESRIAKRFDLMEIGPVQSIARKVYV